MSGERPRISPRPTPRGAARTAASARSSGARTQAGSARAAAAAATTTAPREAHEMGPALGLVEAQRSRRRLRIAGVATATLIFGSMLGLAVFHSVLVQGQLQLDRLDGQITTEQERQTSLRLQVAQLGAPARIIVAAGQQGMVPPDDRKFLAAVVPGTVVPPPVSTKSATSTKSGGATR